MPETLSPQQRVLRARAAVHKSWTNTEDRTARTAPARAAFMRKFEDQVDPTRTLPDAERNRRAESAMKSHMASLALKRSKKGQTWLPPRGRDRRPEGGTPLDPLRGRPWSSAGHKIGAVMSPRAEGSTRAVPGPWQNPIDPAHISAACVGFLRVAVTNRSGAGFRQTPNFADSVEC